MRWWGLLGRVILTSGPPLTILVSASLTTLIPTTSFWSRTDRFRIEKTSFPHAHVPASQSQSPGTYAFIWCNAHVSSLSIAVLESFWNSSLLDVKSVANRSPNQTKPFPIFPENFWAQEIATGPMTFFAVSIHSNLSCHWFAFAIGFLNPKPWVTHRLESVGLPISAFARLAE